MRDAGHVCQVDDYVIEEARRKLAVNAPGSDTVLHGLLQTMKIADLHPSKPPSDAILALPEKHQQSSPRRSTAAAVRS